MNLDIKLLLNHKKQVEYITIDIEEGFGIDISNDEIYDEDLLKSIIQKKLGFNNNVEIHLTSSFRLGGDKSSFSTPILDGHIQIIINSEDDYKYYHRQKIIGKLL